MPNSFSDFPNKLIAWYLENKRDLPWRRETDPYLIWLSEIMLQQTRVEQGLPYYKKFTSAFPDVFQLADATEDEVLKLWQGLGYYSRARNLHYTARVIAEDFNGNFPSSYKELVKLKGIGDYTASAIASICFDEAQAVVDGNVYRVLSRVFGIETAVNSSKGIRQFKTLAQELIDSRDPGTYNQAIMEFGARYCVPRNPDCGNCIFAANCQAYKENKVHSLPVKIRKQQVKKRYFNYIVPLNGSGKTALNQRGERGIWRRLYEFPLVETNGEVTKQELISDSTYRKLAVDYGIEDIVRYTDETVLHRLSHQHLHTHFWIADCKDSINLRIPVTEVADYPVPVLLENFISDFEGFQY